MKVQRLNTRHHMIIVGMWWIWYINMILSMDGLIDRISYMIWNHRRVTWHLRFIDLIFMGIMRNFLNFGLK